MRLFRSRIGLLVALSLGLSACQGAASTHTPSGAGPSTAASAAASADPQRCERLARRGFTPCPPTPDKMQLPPTTIRNATNGAISDATAQQWGRAFQLAQAYYYWAMQHGARSALTSGVLADSSPQAVGNLFGTDLQDLDAAKREGGELEFRPLGISLAQVVTIPETLKEQMRRQGLAPSGYGLVVRFVGPGTRAVRFPDGRLKPLHVSVPGYVATGILWGDLKDDPELGPIWYEHGAYGCEGEVRNVCQL